MAKKIPYAIDKNGEHLFVRAEHCCINHLVMAVDGMSLTFFGNEKTPYIRVTEAIAWHEKELRESHGVSGSKQALEAFQSALKNFEEGKVTEV